MGLDMYLYAREYRSKYDKKKPNYPEELKKLEEMIKEHNFTSQYSEYQIGYWRKFNALHGYIVNTYGGGEDDCSKIYLEQSDLADILAICKKVLEDINKTTGKAKKDKYGNEVIAYESKLAFELLPPVEGFFFGNNEVDDWYKENLEYTIKVFEECLKLEEYTFDFVYQASW